MRYKPFVFCAANIKSQNCERESQKSQKKIIIIATKKNLDCEIKVKIILFIFLWWLSIVSCVLEANANVCKNISLCVCQQSYGVATPGLILACYVRVTLLQWKFRMLSNFSVHPFPLFDLSSFENDTVSNGCITIKSAHFYTCYHRIIQHKLSRFEAERQEKKKPQVVAVRKDLNR